MTLRNRDLPAALNRLERTEVSHMVLQGPGNAANIILGAAECVETIRSFSQQNLSLFTPEQDFILGALLGYDLQQQCQRYLKRKPAEEELNNETQSCRPFGTSERPATSGIFT